MTDDDEITNDTTERERAFIKGRQPPIAGLSDILE